MNKKFYIATLLIILLGSLNNLILYCQPISLRQDIQIKELTSLERNSIRIAKDPITQDLYILQSDGIIKKVNFGIDSTVTLIVSYQASDHGISNPLGMAFAGDGTLFLVGTESSGQTGIATIVKGIIEQTDSEMRAWHVLAKTVEYDYGSTYNHRMSGMAVDPNGKYIYVNSGARTDHGELRNSQREAGLTSIILKLPVDSSNLLLQDDREWLRSNGYIFAEGIRNDFDLKFAPDGELFSVENSGDRDDPEEMNWLREGHHYGFPWKIGGNNTPQQFSPYNPMEDPLLNPNAWGGGNLYQTFSDDPGYPSPPAEVVFTNGVRNFGPDADKFRDTSNGEVKDASELNTSITTFSSHRSPNGLVFDSDSILSNELSGGAFVISLANGNILQALGDNGEDLLHVSLIRNGDNYDAYITRLVYNFSAPLGIEIVNNDIYILETGLWNNERNPKLYKITLPRKGTVGIRDNSPNRDSYILSQNYPNPFNPETRINFYIPQSNNIKLFIYDILGNLVTTLADNFFKAGNHTVSWNGKDNSGKPVSSGIYFYQLSSGADKLATKRMMLLK